MFLYFLLRHLILILAFAVVVVVILVFGLLFI